MEITARNYINLTGLGAFVAFIIYLFFTLFINSEGTLKIVFLALFMVMAIVAFIDALQGDLKDKEIISRQ